MECESSNCFEPTTVFAPTRFGFRHLCDRCYRGFKDGSEEKEIDGKQETLEYRKWSKKAVAAIYLCKTINSLEKEYFESLKKMREKNERAIL